MIDLRIPESFQLFGQTIYVELDASLCDRYENNGLCVYDENLILIDACLSPEQQQHTFLHELMHFVLHLASGADETPPLSDREGLVDRIAGLLHQAFTTAVDFHGEEPQFAEQFFGKVSVTAQPGVQPGDCVDYYDLSGFKRGGVDE